MIIFTEKQLFGTRSNALRLVILGEFILMNIVIHHWNVKATSKETIPALDYITMNRNSAKIGATTPKDIRKFRKEHPVRRKEGDQSMYKAEGVGNGAFTRAKAPLPSDKNVQFTYGKPTR